MSWQALTFQPELPQYCTPTNDFLTRFSSTFHTCVPTPLAFLSTLLGTLSIVSWLFAQMPQIYKNYTIKSTSGLSIFFLVEWCAGDVSNLLGAVFTKQATWQMIVAGYYCLVDFLLVAQWVWYERLRHGYTIRQISAKDIKSPGNGKQSMWRMPVFGDVNEKYGSSRSPRAINRVQASSSFQSPSPRTVLLLACLISLAQGSPLHPTFHHPSHHSPDTKTSNLAAAGTVLSWLSTLLYLGSRLPQLYKNWARKSTAGLSAHLFIAAFFGNLFYSTSMLTNPNLWNDAPAHGLHGWVENTPNVRYDWLMRALPFWLGAAGVLVMDAAVGVQFLMYGESEDAKVVVLEESGRENWRWRRVSGWMRGWVPSFGEPVGRSEDGVHEREALLHQTSTQDYGAAARA
ncbi:PQ loop repeat protein [Aureobasidium namibiae CBS 147.97]|uniref:PQ loop repeat protein n=1 Tax=Aureobasidium namibiae CBS 147.97 TaxID=1043004 RepID=A0A074X213_9PEZI|nr:PQ loop repeat protein [Aureobasidium namibiae CBS 147.97]KEQ76067.1 PQ loop repeat protein [Aureobasidium namibiae CBS 147.97]